MVEIKKLKPLFKSGWRSRLYKGHEWAGNDYVMYDIGQPLDGEKHSSLFGMKPESVRDDVGLIADGEKFTQYLGHGNCGYHAGDSPEDI